MRKYVSKQPNEQGVIDWSEAENQTWQTLYNRQVEIVKGRACDQYIDGIGLLKMSSSDVPQLTELTVAFKNTTGWSVVNDKTRAIF
jgi:phenylalanine-4-hydroxylase